MKQYLVKHFFLILLILGFSACSKDKKPSLPDDKEEEKEIEVPNEPEVAKSIGFFLDNWVPKSFRSPPSKSVSKPIESASVSVSVDMSKVITKVSPSLFGNNTNPYMTQIITEPVLMGHIKNLNPHVLRFPGGNISSVYFWNHLHDKRPDDVPDKLFDSNGNSEDAYYWVGKNEASWTLSLDNFYKVLAQTNSTGMITINYGYARYGTSEKPVEAAAHLAAEWVRYDKGRSKYWEIGNESSGPWQAGFKIDLSLNRDNQPEIVSGAIYGKHFKVFADSMRKAATEIGVQIEIGAQLIATNAANSWNVPDRNWNSTYFAEAGDAADFYIVHDYYDPLGSNSSAATILNTPVKRTGEIMEWMKTTTQTGKVSLKPIALTEWNIGAEGSMQMVSHVAGLQAAIVIGELIKNQFGGANRWNLANGWSNGNDHGLFYQGDDEPGGPPLWNPRPAFYQLYLFQNYFGDRMVQSTITGSDDILCYASSFSSGESGIVLVNKGTSSKVVSLDIKNFQMGNNYYWYILTGGDDDVEFSKKVYINGVGPNGPSGGPLNYKDIPAHKTSTDGKIKIAMPARSAGYIIVEKSEM